MNKSEVKGLPALPAVKEGVCWAGRKRGARGHQTPCLWAAFRSVRTLGSANMAVVSVIGAALSSPPTSTGTCSALLPGLDRDSDCQGHGRRPPPSAPLPKGRLGDAATTELCGASNPGARVRLSGATDWPAAASRCRLLSLVRSPRKGRVPPPHFTGRSRSRDLRGEGPKEGETRNTGGASPHREGGRVPFICSSLSNKVVPYSFDWKDSTLRESTLRIQVLNVCCHLSC